MRKLIMWNMATLDGLFEGKQSWDLDFHEVGWGEELERFANEQMDAGDTLLFGRKTYEGMAQYWSTAKGETADRMYAIQKVVFSRTLASADWVNTRLVSTDAAEEVARLKAEPGRDILVFGSAELCASLMRAGLIDEYRIGLNPIVLGQGTPLFKPGASQTTMRLLEARPLQTGCVLLRYAPVAAA
ncbi:MAG TPA: dihydrofolate reductase family protein [Longimicrobium sp.]|nr:dihydrofolate reductase family protein [Longimicrobium sp.]